MSSTDFVRTGRFFDLLDEAAGIDPVARARAIVRIVREGVPGAATLLDVACGAGATLAELATAFAVTGVESDPIALQIARSRDGLERTRLGTPETFETAPPADVVLALRGAVAVARTAARLDEVVARLAAARAPGGVVLVEPFASPERYETGAIEAVHVDAPRKHLSRMMLRRRGSNIAIMDFHTLVATSRGVERHFERVERGLYDEARYALAFDRAGLALDRIADPAFPSGLLRGR